MTHVGEYRMHALATLAADDCREGTDWRWADSPIPVSVPLVLDSPRHLAVYEWDASDGKPPYPVILIRASGVRKLGGQGIAARMESGEFPAEMPYATVGHGPDEMN